METTCVDAPLPQQVVVLGAVAKVPVAVAMVLVAVVMVLVAVVMVAAFVVVEGRGAAVERGAVGMFVVEGRCMAVMRLVDAVYHGGAGRPVKAVPLRQQLPLRQRPSQILRCMEVIISALLPAAASPQAREANPKMAR